MPIFVSVDVFAAGSVPDLQSRILACIPRITVMHVRGPLLTGMRDLTMRTGLIRHGGISCPRAVQTRIRHTRERGTGCKDIWIRAGKDIGHNRPGRGSRHVYLGRIRAVCRDHVFDHVDDRQRVATAVVRERCRAVGVEAVVISCRARIYEDISIMLGWSVVIVHPVVLRGTPAAGVHL